MKMRDYPILHLDKHGNISKKGYECKLTRETIQYYTQTQVVKGTVCSKKGYECK